MNSIANTTVSLYRGTETSEYDDEVDSNDTPYLTNEPASIIEIPTPAVTMNTETPTPRIIRTARMRIKNTIDVQKGDRVKDEQSGQFYTIEYVSALGNPAMTNDRRVNLRWQ